MKFFLPQSQVSCLLIGCVCIALGGCGSAQQPAQPAAQAIGSDQLVGKWRLVSAGDEPPSSLNIESLLIEIAADGTWTSDIVMQGPFAGMSMNGGGKWSLHDNVVDYTSGDNSGQSHPRLEPGRLILDPDFSIRKDGTIEVAGEYERVSP
jgi:hypothetical protein